MPQKKTIGKHLSELFEIYNFSRLKSDYEEYKYRKSNHFANRWLYYGLAFSNKVEIDEFEKYLRSK